jgi:hypothetical protein
MSAPHESRLRGRAFCLPLLPFAFCLLPCIALTSCAAPRLITLPSDQGTPFPDFASVHAQISTACAAVRTLKGELGLSGNLGDERLRGTVVAGFERPSSMRLDMVAPFGGPIFILAARDGAGTLLLPREDRIIRNAPPEAILEALTGVALAPADLLAVFTGCVLPGARATAGRTHGGDWTSIDIESAEQGSARRTATLYVRRTGAQWQLRAATRDRWRIEYTAGTGVFPQVVRLVSTNSAVPVDLRAALSQLETNQDIDPAAWRVEEQKGLMPLTVDELRRAGPLRGQ